MTMTREEAERDELQRIHGHLQGVRDGIAALERLRWQGKEEQIDLSGSRAMLDIIGERLDDYVKRIGFDAGSVGTANDGR